MDSNKSFYTEDAVKLEKILERVNCTLCLISSTKQEASDINVRSEVYYILEEAEQYLSHVQGQISGYLYTELRQ